MHENEISKRIIATASRFINILGLGSWNQFMKNA
jgi:hypothetical protein